MHHLIRAFTTISIVLTIQLVKLLVAFFGPFRWDQNRVTPYLRKMPLTPAVGENHKEFAHCSRL